MKDDKKLEAPSKKRVPIKFRKGEDDGTGRLAMEDVYASGYKVKSYVDPETGQTKTRKVRAHRIEFKNSRMGAQPEITKEEKMKKTFSQFKEEYGLNEAKFAKGGIPSAPNTGNKDDGYTKRQRQRAAKKRAEELTRQRRQRAMGEEYDLTEGGPIPEEQARAEARRKHYKEKVLPIYKKHGLSPQFAKAVDAHVAQHGTHEVWNHHGDADGRMPDWFDEKNKKVKKLKKAYIIDEGFTWEVDDSELCLEDFSLEEIEDFMMSEEFEQLDELSKATLASYRDKANKQIDRGLMRSRDIRGDKTAMKRMRNIGKAQKRLANEELDLEDFSLEEIEDFMMSEEFEQLDELSKKTLKSYAKKAQKNVNALHQAGTNQPYTAAGALRADNLYRKAGIRQDKVYRAREKMGQRIPEEYELDEAAWPKSFDRSRRTGDETATSHSVSKTATGTKYSKMFDPDGISKGTGDDAAKAAEGVKRGRGRPRKNPLPSGHQAAADLQGLMGSKLPKKAAKLPSTKHSMGEALEVLFDLDEETFDYMMEEYGLDASIEIIQNELEEGLADDILAAARKVSPNAKVRPSVADQIKKRNEMIKAKPPVKGGSDTRHEKYPLGGHDPVSNRSYSD